MEKEIKVRVVCCVDDTYARYLPTLLYSLSKTNPNAEAYIIYKELSPMVHDFLMALAERLDQLTLVLVPIDDSLLQGISNTSSRLPLTAYYRILAPLILPKTVQRVLYLDVDLVVNASLVELFQLDLQGYSVAGVKELEPYQYPEDRLYAIGLTEADDYINSGVLLIDVAKWRKEQTVSKLIAFAEQHAQGLVFGDQDIINLYFKGRILLLAKTYNYCRDFMRDEPYVIADLAILHFNYIKPWVSRFRLPEWLLTAADYYRQVRNAANQCLNLPPLISVIVPVFNMRNQILEALESIGNQLFGPFEIVVVDAGSMDGTREIILDYAQTDCRVRYFEKTCDSLYQAYQFGLEQSQAEYVTVVYPWGALEEQYLLTLYNVLSESSADIVVGGYLAYRGGSGFYPSPVEGGQVLTASSGDVFLRAEAFRRLSGKLLRRSLLASLSAVYYSEGEYIEQLYQKAHQVVTTSANFYISKENDDSKPYLEDAFITCPKPLVSLVIVLREDFSTGRDALEALLSKEAKVAFELVIVDLSDKEVVLDSLPSISVQRLRLSKSLSTAEARAFGLANSRGDYLVFFGDDLGQGMPMLLWQCEVAVSKQLDMICASPSAASPSFLTSESLRRDDIVFTLIETPRVDGLLFRRDLLAKAIGLGVNNQVLSDTPLALVRLLYLSDKIGLLPLERPVHSIRPPQTVQEFQLAYEELETLILDLLLAGCHSDQVRTYFQAALKTLNSPTLTDYSTDYTRQALAARLNLFFKD